METKRVIFIALALVGLLAGLAASASVQTTGDSRTYCDSIQNQIKANQSFSGSVACYPPGELEVNVSDQVEENAELRCVCRIIDGSGISIFPVAISE